MAFVSRAKLGIPFGRKNQLLTESWPHTLLVRVDFFLKFTDTFTNRLMLKNKAVMSEQSFTQMAGPRIMVQ